MSTPKKHSSKAHTSKKHRKKKKKLSPGTIIGRILAVIASTLGIILLSVVLLILILIKGPSPEAGRLFTLSANETSAMKWLPTLFMSESEHQAILNPVQEEDSFVEFPLAIAPLNDNDQTSVNMNTESASAVGTYEIVDLKASTYKGKMLIVHNPQLVQVGSIDSFGETGITLSQFLNKYNAIACTNAGGFEDEGGTGKGGIPDGIVIKNGQIVYGSAGGYYSGVVGFDSNGFLHVGNMTGSEALSAGIVSGTCFNGGPVLIQNGVRQTNFVSGINPRTCIGQTSDGSVLLVAIEGRMADSLGATFDDLADLMEQYGAVNACNLDGGSSSGLYFEGERLTRSCSVVGDRPLPTAIIVLREDAQ